MAQYLLHSEPLKILLVAPEEQTDFIISEIPKAWNIMIANSLDECNEKLDDTVAMILIDDRVVGDELKGFLESIEVQNPVTRFVLLLHEFQNIDAINLFNEGIIHKVLHSTSTNINEILLSTAREYIASMEQQKTQELMNKERKKREENPNSPSFMSEDQLLDLSLMLTDTEIKDFTNQFVSIIQGVQSFISINFSIFEDTGNEVNKNNVFRYLSDLELLANQYDQRTLMIYVEIVKSYFYLYLSMIEEAMFHYKSAVRVFYWISNEYIDPNLVDTINNFPIMEDEYYYIAEGEKEFKPTPEVNELIREKLNVLIKHDIQKLTNLSKTLYQFMRIDTEILSSVLVVRGSLPLFIFENTDKPMDPALISGFVDAFSSFLQELVDGRGDIDNIQHDKGIILIHRENDIKFLIVAKHDEVYLRMGLRQFAKDTLKLFEGIPQHQQVNDDEYEILVDKIRDLFKIKKQ